MELTKPFKVGKTYTRLDGKQVTCIKVNMLHNEHSTAQFDDFQESYDRVMTKYGEDPVMMDIIMEDPDWKDATRSGHRYNRASDRGRCTASQFDDPLNVIPEVNPHIGPDHLEWLLKPYKLYKIKGP